MLSKTTSELPFTKDKVAVEASAVKVLICVKAPLKEEITSVIALIELYPTHQTHPILIL